MAFFKRLFRSKGKRAAAEPTMDAPDLSKSDSRNKDEHSVLSINAVQLATKTKPLPENKSNLRTAGGRDRDISVSASISTTSQSSSSSQGSGTSHRAQRKVWKP